MPHSLSENETPPKIGVREFRAKFAGFMRLAQAGHSFLVTSNNQVVAEIRPPSRASTAARQPGVLRGRIRIAADFDSLPEDVLAAMEGG